MKSNAAGSVFIINLGCAKNLVDSSVLSQILTNAGFRLANSQREARFIIVNTCGFIHDARIESQEVIADALKTRRKGQFVIASGCLSQRLDSQLYELFPSLDGLIGTRSLRDILPLLRHLSLGGQPERNPLTYYPQLQSDPDISNTIIQGGSSYLKIADGCHRTCAFCAIPLIKGSLVSRPKDVVIRDAISLQELGVKEINLIAQDVTSYGRDHGETDALADLLAELLPQIPNVPWVRLLYTYPGVLTDRLIELMAANKQLLPYLDMPLQHADPAVLKAMSRPSNVNWVIETIAKMRYLIPDLVVRTSMIVGYPNESEESFFALREFIQQMAFDHLGVFTYSPEVDTLSYPLGDPIPQEIKEARKAELMELQAGISLTKHKKLLGKTLSMLVEGVNPHERLLVGRTYRDAPEIDGLTLAKGVAAEGSLVPVRVTNVTEYDLIAEQIKE